VCGSPASPAFAAAGLAVSEWHRSRRVVVRHLLEKEAAEAESKAIVETSPLAVLTLDEAVLEIFRPLLNQKRSGGGERLHPVGHAGRKAPSDRGQRYVRRACRG
jgi:hypothetical protein